VPHLYDMHSSLPQQLGNFKFSQSRVLRWVFERFERVALARSRVVIVICPELERLVRELRPGSEPVLIENAPGAGESGGVASAPRVVRAAVRTRYGLQDTAPVILYTGTFEAYQGLELLFAAAPSVLRARPDARFVLAGGAPAQIDAFKSQVRSLGIDGQVAFTGERPASEIPDLLAAADVLVSPRSRGTNTPLKIYQYLRSGRVIVATRLLTHTQVLDDGVAILTEATPAAFAAGILQAIGDPAAAARIGAAAAELAATKYSYEAYLARTREAIGRLGADSRATLSGSAA
jgi:glycosyltransferase involved in cell wall biosynthesis